MEEFDEKYVSPARQKKLDANPDYVPSERTGQTATYDAGGTCVQSTGIKRKFHKPYKQQVNHILIALV